MPSSPVLSRITGRRIGAAAIVALVVVAVVLSWSMLVGADETANDTWDTTWYTVSRRSFPITIVSTGELEAKEKVEIKNKVEGQTTITEIVDEGTVAKEGDVIARLADDEIRNRVEQEELNVENATADQVAAEQDLAIKKSEAGSRLKDVQVKLELSKLDLAKWKQGDVVKERKRLELAHEEANRKLARYKRDLEYSKKLYEDKYISKSELETGEDSVLEWKNKFETAMIDIDVYEKYTYPKERRKFVTDVEQATAELDRVQRQNESELAQTHAKLSSKQRSLKIREDRLAKLREQLDATVIKAPKDGLVVYGTSVGPRWRRRDPIRQGRQIGFNETIFILPDTRDMLATVKVHEAVIPQVKVDQTAVITIDAHAAERVKGTVTQIGTMAEDGGWMNPELREYDVKIQLPLEALGDKVSLKPAMRCTATITVGQVDNAKTVPVQAVFAEGEDSFCYVPAGHGKVERRIVKLGRASETYVAIEGGLEEDDRVLLREPRPGEVQE